MNKRILSSLLALAMLTTIPISVSASDQGDIVILHTNDTHCDIENDHGFAGVAGYKAFLLSQGYDVTLVDAGDFVQGDAIGALTQGEAIIDIMNQVGYDIVTLGNHEFDYQVPQMFQLMEQLDAKKVSSNFMDLTTNTSVFDAYVIERYGDVDVAYIGITTPESFTKSTPTYFQDEDGNYLYGFCEENQGQDLYDNVQASIDSALAQGADYVVAIAHLGTQADAAPWRSTDVIANTTGLDVMMDGHSHTVSAGEEVLDLEGNVVLMSQTGEKFNNIGKITISDGTITAELVSLADYDQKDETVQGFVDDINASFETLLSQVVASSDVDVTSVNPVSGERIIRSQESNLGDLVADAYRCVLGADVSLVNGGSMRADLTAGDITYADIIAVNPWGNDLASVRVSGQTILDALELGAANSPEENPGFMQVSGMSYTVDLSIPSSVVTDDKGNFLSVEGPYRVKDVVIGTEPLDLETLYVVGSHAYLLLSFGDGMVMFDGAEVVKDRFMVDNEAIISYIVDTLGGVVGQDYANPYGQGRITIYDGENHEIMTPNETAEETPVADLWEDTTPRTYTVVAGDCLWNIASRELGAGVRWEEVFALNAERISSVYTLQIGQVLTLPGV